MERMLLVRKTSYNLRGMFATAHHPYARIPECAMGRMANVHIVHSNRTGLCAESRQKANFVMLVVSALEIALGVWMRNVRMGMFVMKLVDHVIEMAYAMAIQQHARRRVLCLEELCAVRW